MQKKNVSVKLDQSVYERVGVLREAIALTRPGEQVLESEVLRRLISHGLPQLEALHGITPPAPASPQPARSAAAPPQAALPFAVTPAAGASVAADLRPPAPALAPPAPPAAPAAPTPLRAAVKRSKAKGKKGR